MPKHPLRVASRSTACLLPLLVLASIPLDARGAEDSPGCEPLLAASTSSSATLPIVLTWLDLIRLNPSADGDAWLAQLATELPLSEDAAAAFTPPGSAFAAEVVQGLSELAHWAEGLAQQGALTHGELAVAIREALRSELVSHQSAEAAGTEAGGARTATKSGIDTLPRPAEPEGNLVALPNGGFAFAGRDSRAYFYDRDLNIISPPEKLGLPDIGLVPLAGGNFLFFAHWGPIFVLDSAGHFIRRVESPSPHTTRSTMTPLPGGNVWVCTDGGAALILDANGNPKTTVPIRHELENREKAVSLSDGTFWVGTGRKMARFSETGEVLTTIPAPNRRLVIQSLAAFEDGTLIVADHTRTFHFLNSDGTPRKKAWIFNLTHGAPGTLAYPFYRTLSNHMAVATNNGVLELLDSNARVTWKSTSYSSVAGPPIELAKDTFLFRNRNAELVIDGPAMPGPKLVQTPPGEVVDFRPKKLSDGTFVLTYNSGLVQVFSADGTLLYGHRLRSRASHDPVLLSDGRLLVACMDHTLRVIDPNHVGSM